MSGSWPGSFPPMPGHGHFHPPPPMHWGMGPPNMPPPMPPFPGPPPPFSGGPPGPAQPATVYQQASQSDEIRTIYITGLPSDTKERELVNLMRFLPGHEVRCGGAGTPLVPCAGGLGPGEGRRVVRDGEGDRPRCTGGWPRRGNVCLVKPGLRGMDGACPLCAVPGPTAFGRAVPVPTAGTQCLIQTQPPPAPRACLHSNSSHPTPPPSPPLPPPPTTSPHGMCTTGLPTAHPRPPSHRLCPLLLPHGSQGGGVQPERPDV